MLFIDRGFPVDPFARALAPGLRCLESVSADERGAVVGLVTGIVPVGEPEVAELPALRVVVSASTGTDHLDLVALTKRGVIVCNTPTYCTEEVADHALACILAGWRGLWRLGAAAAAGRWDCNEIGLLRRTDQSRLGIVGLGRIGRALARRALALGIDVVAHDPYVEAVPDVRMLELDELLVTSDAVSLHAPGMRGARPLIDAARLALMRSDAVLVNLARAELVDLDALVTALETGALGGAAFDVWPSEPPDPGDARLRVPGLLVTPHAGWSSPQADDAYRAEAIASLRAVLLDDIEPPARVA